ncbi:hypothetical protein [Clostridium botulinum]|uniref:hypothetical protein n=1 Tax=Clostridium botulinum TaxID=1491 RepID=UPI001966D0B0|nr:hypothetical protein [Clostridium botulinum]MBN1058123.1 hypothetical protein [Clostridium botulinum]MBN1061419.1 hypothetical protein [Clostridium botulinum]
MYRIVNAKQVIGSIFMELINQQRNSILLRDIFKIENEIDCVLRKNQLNAITLMNIDDIYQVAYSYENILKLEQRNVSIQQDYSVDNYLQMMLEDCFISGIPNDIEKVITECVREWLKYER